MMVGFKVHTYKKRGKMENITVKKSELLEILKKNREAHRKIFEEAQIGYRNEAIRLLDKALNDAQEGRKIKTYIQLEAPIDQTKDYDRAIRMLEMSIDEEIDLSEREFAELVLDDWSWKQQFTVTNARYTNMIHPE